MNYISPSVNDILYEFFGSDKILHQFNINDNKELKVSSANYDKKVQIKSDTPIKLKDKTSVIMCNGEIFFFQKMPHPDERFSLYRKDQVYKGVVTKTYLYKQQAFHPTKRMFVHNESGPAVITYGSLIEETYLLDNVNLTESFGISTLEQLQNYIILN